MTNTNNQNNNSKMKKIFLLAAAVIAFAACSKVELNLPETSEIGFSPNALQTKALILPNGNSSDSLAFPTSEAFNVFAFATLPGEATNYASPLMNDVEISYHVANTNTNAGDWKATSGTYLWPAAGTVDFYAYYPGTITAVYDTTETPKGLSLTGINLGASIGYQNDPMVASVLAQNATAKKRVPLVFKHITSQIAVTAFDATETEQLKGKISIEKVVFKNMKTTGKYREGTTAGKGQWSDVNTKVDFTPFFGSQLLAETESFLSNDSFSASIDNNAAFVVIPVDVVNTDGEAQVIEVSYSIAAYTINNFNYPATPTQTVTVPLYNKISGNKFQNGMRYVFHIGISLDGANNEIMFSPVVEGWNTEDVNGITIDAFNHVLL